MKKKIFYLKIIKHFLHFIIKKKKKKTKVKLYKQLENSIATKMPYKKKKLISKRNFIKFQD